VGYSSGSTGVFALAAGSAGVLLVAADTIRDTIMRTRGNLCAWIDGLETPAVAVRVSVGMIVVPEGTAATVLWAPFTDETAPWFYHTEFTLGYEEMVTDVIDVPGISSYREVIDSKAMRIADPDTEVQLVVENTTITGAASVNVSVSGRFLLGR